VGLTALGVAAMRATETARSDRLFADPCAAAFVHAAGYDPGARPAPATHEEIAERRRLTAWIGVRTRFLDDVVRRACEQGCRQIVLLGAGLDARAFRLELPVDSRLWELDLPDVLRFKESVVRAHEWLPRCERTIVETDLSEDWGSSLLRAGFGPRARVVWVAEGLLSYLPEEVRDALIETTGALSITGSRLGLTLAASAAGEATHPAEPAGAPTPRGYRALFRSSAPDDAHAWLASYGWQAHFFGVSEQSASYGRPSPSDGTDRARLVDATRV
jgi:methyltransferase (TIGR00027 family)